MTTTLPANFRALRLEPTPPRAWMGYRDLNIVAVCCYCPDKDQADAEAASAGQFVSHGICPECRARLPSS